MKAWLQEFIIALVIAFSYAIFLFWVAWMVAQ